MYFIQALHWYAVGPTWVQVTVTDEMLSAALKLEKHQGLLLCLKQPKPAFRRIGRLRKKDLNAEQLANGWLLEELQSTVERACRPRRMQSQELLPLSREVVAQKSNAVHSHGLKKKYRLFT